MSASGFTQIDLLQATAQFNPGWVLLRFVRRIRDYLRRTVV